MPDTPVSPPRPVPRSASAAHGLVLGSPAILSPAPPAATAAAAAAAVLASPIAVATPVPPPGPLSSSSPSRLSSSLRQMPGSPARPPPPVFPSAQPQQPAAPLAEEGIALGFSGGGIRSAAIASGTLCYLHSRGWLKQVTDISAVSGGAYTATSYVLWRKTDRYSTAEEWVHEYLSHMSRNAGYCVSFSHGIFRGLRDIAHLALLVVLTVLLYLATEIPFGTIMCFTLATAFRHVLVPANALSIVIFGFILFDVIVMLPIIARSMKLAQLVHASPHLCKNAHDAWKGVAYTVLPPTFVVVFVAIGQLCFTHIGWDLGIFVLVSVVLVFIGQTAKLIFQNATSRVFQGIMTFAVSNMLHAWGVAYLLSSTPVTFAGVTIPAPSAEGVRIALLLCGIVVGFFRYTIAHCRLTLWPSHNRNRLRQAFYPVRDHDGAVIDPPISALAADEDSGRIPRLHVAVSVSNWVRPDATGSTHNAGQAPVAITSRSYIRYDNPLVAPIVLPYSDPEAAAPMPVSQVMAVSAAAVGAEVNHSAWGLRALQVAILAFSVTMTWWHTMYKVSKRHVWIMALFYALTVMVPCVLVYWTQNDYFVFIVAIAWAGLLFTVTLSPDPVGNLSLGAAAPVRDLYELVNFDRQSNSRFPTNAYLTDGGQTENLGLLPLLLAGKRRIVLVDADADPEEACHNLFHAIKLARLHLGVTIVPPESAVSGDDVVEYLNSSFVGYGASPVVNLRIHYMDGTEGELLVLKPRGGNQTLTSLGSTWEASIIRNEEAGMPGHFRAMHGSVLDMDDDQVTGCCCDSCQSKLCGVLLCSDSQYGLCGRYPNTTTSNQLFSPRLFNVYHRAGFMLVSSAHERYPQFFSFSH